MGKCIQKIQCLVLLNIIFLLIRIMEKKRRSSYNKIDEEVRMMIIERILRNGESIKDVSAEMGVNISTCKAMLKVYQEEGRIGKKKQRNKVFNVIQTFSFYCITDNLLEQVENIKIEESKLSIERGTDQKTILQANAKAKAQKMFDIIAQNRYKSQLASAALQTQQMMQMQLMQNNFMQFFNGGYPSPLCTPRQDQQASVTTIADPTPISIGPAVKTEFSQ